MSDEPKIMTTVRGEMVSVSSYKEARQIMAAYHDLARNYARVLAEDPASAHRHLRIAHDMERAYDENLEVYQHFMAQADIERAIAVMLQIAEQTKTLS